MNEKGDNGSYGGTKIDFVVNRLPRVVKTDEQGNKGEDKGRIS